MPRYCLPGSWQLLITPYIEAGKDNGMTNGA